MVIQTYFLWQDIVRLRGCPFLGHADATGCDRKSMRQTRVKASWDRHLANETMDNRFMFKDRRKLASISVSHHEHQEMVDWSMEAAMKSWEIWRGRVCGLCVYGRIFFLLSPFLCLWDCRYILDSSVFLAYRSRGWVHVLNAPGTLPGAGSDTVRATYVINIWLTSPVLLIFAYQVWTIYLLNNFISMSSLSPALLF